MLAAVRHDRDRTRRELWGNLATPEGVEEMLSTGWKVKGTYMHVYDRADVGYSDDDSLLKGGYENSQIFGAEVTLNSTASPHDTTSQHISTSPVQSLLAAS